MSQSLTELVRTLQPDLWRRFEMACQRERLTRRWAWPPLTVEERAKVEEVTVFERIRGEVLRNRA